MEVGVGDILHCEEKLRSTLHSDDKEKLRRKLAQLQREYLRTAQRLQRAERLDAVRKHVRKKIALQTHQDQRGPEATSVPCVNPLDPLTLNTSSAETSGLAHTEGPADSEQLRRSQVVTFQLPSAAASYPQTPDHSLHANQGYRPSPTLSLRSRRSRLRCERRSVEAERITDNDEKGPDQSGRVDTTGATEQEEEEEEEEDVKSEATNVNKCVELVSDTESDSPSLLLSHWSAHGYSDTGGVKGKEIQQQEQRAKETELRVAEEKKESTSALTTEEREQDKNGRELSEMKICEENSNEDGNKENAGEKIESGKNQDDKTDLKEDGSGNAGDGKAGSLLDSCTLVEGLLFPAEYYVRTTRRMTLSQSQPDMQAVILSQLSLGRRRRSRGRGRGRGSDRNSHTSQSSDQRTETDFSSPTSADPLETPHCPSSSEISDRTSSCRMNSDTCFSPAVTPARPARGRRRKRGRGRGRPQTPRPPLGLDPHQLDRTPTSHHPQHTCTPLSSSHSLHDEPPGERAPAESIDAAALHLSTEVNRAPSNSASGHVEKVFPIFLKSNDCSTRSPQTNRSSSSWRSLLLPSSPLPLLPLPSPSPSGLLSKSSLMNLDTHQDFHLPDDQFASLKLLKLRQAALGSGVEHLLSPSYNTRSSMRRFESLCSSSEAATPAPLPLSLTPTISNSPRPVEERQAGSEHTLRDQSQGRPLSEEPPGESENLEVETHSSCDCGAQSSSFTDKPAGDSISGRSDKNKTKPTAPETEDQRNLRGDALIKTLDFDRPLQVMPCNDGSVLPAKEESPKKSSQTEAIISPDAPIENQTDYSPQRALRSQLLRSPVVTPRLPSCTQTSSPVLPSLGLTPYAGPLTSSPSAPSLNLPPPHSPSTQALSPPALSPCPSIAYLPPTPPPPPPPPSPPSSEATGDHRAEPSGCYLQGSGEEGLGLKTQERGEEPTMRSTHTLKAAAGGRLVDACCLPGSSGGLCVAAAGKWAVCLWSQTPASDWSLTHTWTFNEPVISVFPVPDAAGLMCVALGQLEIREVRMLSCSSFAQTLFREGVVQAVVGVSKSRVVTSSHSATGSILQAFTLSDTSSSPSSQVLASPDVCVGSLAPVDRLPDALIGTDEAGHLFLWNLNSGQLLCRVLLGDNLCHTACLRGYSYCGVLFVLLQHQFLSSLEEEEKEEKLKCGEFLEEEKKKKKKTLFSLVAINPLSGKSVLATRLHPPKAWSGRLCEADASRSRVVGLSQSGCVCVWELGRPGASRMLWAPESEGWQLARWGGDTLVTGHHNGDVTLHCFHTFNTGDTKIQHRTQLEF
ncbi:partner and localizer of BRCA2 [Mugil cephalus]|uniref:partner and localizer of BRCA2 n=1 Tax=Mugil cephalus TaxID=48193 RepID=UPI001FB6B475|nr:partner and localizer of BRCA2 [Mugil cephalus]